MTGTAYAHRGDYWNGKHINNRQNDFRIVISDTAYNSLFNKELFKGGASFWNVISENVNVSVEFRENYSASDFVIDLGNQMCIVIGAAPEDMKGGLGRMVPYDRNGNPTASDSGLNSDWLATTITLNIDESAFSRASDPSKAARKTYIHEIGHALKLSHPVCDPSLYLHSYDKGYPLSVMNQGFPGEKSGAVYETVRYHDEINLKAKWGE